MAVLMDPGEDPEDTLRAHRSREKAFIFDTVFDQHASQVPAPPPPSSRGLRQPWVSHQTRSPPEGHLVARWSCL